MRRFGLKTDDRGVAMMVCITIIAILMIFSFSLLSVAYTLYSSQNNAMQQDRNAEAAKTLSMALREELTAESETSNLCKYLRYNIVAKADALVPENLGTTWPPYDPANPELGKRYFKLNKSDYADIKGVPSETGVCMWWTQPDPADPEVRVYLFVEVECRSGSQSYVVTSKYQLNQIQIPGQRSEYIRQSLQSGINPAKNYIDTDYIWRWIFVESE